MAKSSEEHDMMQSVDHRIQVCPVKGSKVCVTDVEMLMVKTSGSPVNILQLRQDNRVEVII